MNSKILGLHFMPAENCVCAVSLHGNRKLSRPLKKKKKKAHRDDTQPCCGNAGVLGPGWVAGRGVVSYPRKFSVSALFSYHI